MARSSAETVEGYLRALPPDRRAAIERVRSVVGDALPEGYAEVMQYGMISWVVPLERHPETYNGQPLAVASLGNQKRYMSLYLHAVYGEREAGFREEYARTGRRLDMGRSCVRFRTLDDLPLDLVARTLAATPVDDFIRQYEAARRR